MRQVDRDTWECTACGDQVRIARGKRPFPMLVTASGRLRERVITVDDEVVHRCTLGIDHPEHDVTGGDGGD